MARIKQRSDISVHIVGTFFFRYMKRDCKGKLGERQRKIEFK